MIDRYLYSDISEQVRHKIVKKYGGWSLLGWTFLTDKGKEEHKRIMLLSFSEINAYLKE